MNYTQHKLSAAFPAMTDGEFQGLVADIGANGQRHPIIIFEGAVIDGFHRLRACKELGIEPQIEPYSGSDPAGYVLSSNLHRRHLEPGQIAAIMLACNEWRARGRPDKQFRTGVELTVAQMAEQGGISERTLENAKIAIKAGFGDMLKDGGIGPKPAAEMAKSAPEVAARVVAKEITPAQGKAEMQAKVKRELPTPPAPDLNAELDRLDAQIMDMRAELIELRAASHDEQLRAQARDEIAGLREALALEQRLHAALKAQSSAQDDRLNDWKRRCASLERQLDRRERGE